ncbi:endonuclease MutS2 [Treponema sp.]|uniref:endonuclease MutS2 n=1 Tax=Treponema sp. TaxID=166 RepID=UPI00298E7C64|nr:Smr/MutS family protein [Treponema sp.]MCQ2242546.1 Smr/MutS family protein [Treponema sp.]
MNKTLEQIDYYTIRDSVADCAISEEGKNYLLRREPYHDAAKIEHLKNASREWERFMSRTNSLPFGPWEPVYPLIPVIHATGSALTLQQLYALGQFCNEAKRVTDSVKEKEIELEFKVLPEETAKLMDLSDAWKIIFRILTPDGELRDLPEIQAIRKQIADLNQKIKMIMHRYCTDNKLSDILESNVPVLKNGRQVLAVRAGQQNKIKGLVHEVSVSGRTVYVEPEDSVYATNELIEKEYELQEEIKKILIKTTEELQPSIPAFRENIPLMNFFDATWAAAKWGKENECVYALPCSTTEELPQSQKNNTDNQLSISSEPPLLLNARHPLLGERCVPITIRFMDGKRVLIITGPNTGGKTVSLKTFALLSMLNQSGFPVPAGEGTRLPVFENIYADIGDEQSLDQSLSTFSGHMKNIAKAVKKAGPASLVLLDELGSGTDPQEGTALSMSVLDHLIERQAFVLVTTHMGILKNYGYTNPHCINASVEFNTDTLAPSYHLLMGVPGESHALDIAAKSGLPHFIVKNAKHYIATEQTDVSALIKGLSKKHSELDKLRNATEKEAQAQEEKGLRLAEKEVQLRRKEHELKNNKTRELDEFMRQSRRELENLVRQIREGEITRDKTVSVKQYIAELEANGHRLEEELEAEEEKIREAEIEVQKASEKIRTSHKKTKKRMKLSEALKYAESAPTPSEKTDTKSKGGAKETVPLTFAPGVEVEVGAMKNRGTLVEKDKKGNWVVQFGSVRMTAKEKDIRLVKGPSVGSPTVSVVVEKAEADNEYPQFELRLLGMYADEAIRALEHQLDLCAIHNFPRFSIVHGKGSGVLQQAVHDYLSHYHGVKEFSFAPPEDGGFGKTYVVLR